MPMALLALDFRKAFDSVSHSFLLRVLSRFGFPPEFCAMVRTLYSDAVSVVRHNGFVCDPVPVLSGVRQGCPLSAALFVCALEPLLARIQSDVLCGGIHVPGGGGVALKYIAYMDDISLVCTAPGEAGRCLRHVERFGAASGLALNLEKCSGITVGPWNSMARMAVDVSCPSVKVLGVNFNRAVSGAESWAVLKGKVNQKLGLWSSRSLTMTGRILVIKAVILPLLLYTAVVFPPDLALVRQLQRMLCVFFWNSKLERVSRVTLYKDPKKGGRGFPDLLLFLYGHTLAYYVRLVRDGGSVAAYFLAFYLRWSFHRAGWASVDNRVPARFDVLPHLASLLKVVARYELHLIPLTSITVARQVFAAVRARDLPAGIGYRPPALRDNVWKYALHPCLLNRHKDLVWESMVGALPLRSLQHARGICATAACPRQGCGVEETCYHAFWYCQYTQDFWTSLRPMLIAVLGFHLLTFEMVLFGSHGGISKPLRETAWKIFAAAKAALWRTRNQKVLLHQDASVQDCIRLMLADMHEYYRLDLRRLDVAQCELLWKRQDWYTWRRTWDPP